MDKFPCYKGLLPWTTKLVQSGVYGPAEMERETKLKVVDLLPVHLKLIVPFSLKFYQSFRRNITLAVTLSLLCSNTFELKAAHKKRMRSSLGAFFS